MKTIHPTCSIIPLISIVTGMFILTGCAFMGSSSTRNTQDIPVVKELDLDRYLGTWYEIVRLPHRFERDLINVTATYSWRDDGKIEVLNRGYNTRKMQWSEAIGKAWLPDPSQPGVLKVSFFWIFASDYRVIALDPDYQWAMITSKTRDYLWILSRTPKLEESLYQSLLDKIQSYGFAMDKIIEVEQTVKVEG